MDELKKTTHVNSASIIDLKAELVRKQNEFKLQKLQSSSSGSFVKAKPVEKKPNIWSKKNAGVLQRAQKDIEQKIEEENEFEKSRKALQAKSALYEKITQGSEIPEEDGSHMYLVDFQKKAIDNIVEKREEQRKKEEEKAANYEREFLEKVAVPPTTDEEWVDYTDSLGRSRRCMKKDLPDLIKRDEELTGKKGTDRNLAEEKDMPTLMSHDMRREMLRQKWEKEEQEALNKPVGPVHYANVQFDDMPTLMSHDMRREMLRQKWEKEEQEALNKPVGPVHYANVQFDEIRTHGVGFYQFAKDETTRQEQMETLTDLRKQTVDERERKERLKEKRKAMLDARLAKVKQRKMMREGGGLFGLVSQKEEDKSEMEDSDEIGPKIGDAIIDAKPDTFENKKKEPELLVRDDTLKQNVPVREWDKGKEKLFAREDKYIADRRAERCEEFAPPPSYFEMTPISSLPHKKNFSANKPVFAKTNKTNTENSTSGSTRPSESSDSIKTPEQFDPSSIPLPETITKTSNSSQSQLPLQEDFLSKPYQCAGNVIPETVYNPGYSASSLSSGHALPIYNPNIPPPPSSFVTPVDNPSFGNQGQQQIYVNQEHGGYIQNQQQKTSDTTSAISYNIGQVFQQQLNQSSATTTSLQETVVPNPVKLNIVDPRFIQNRETLKDGVSNLSMLQSDAGVNCSSVVKDSENNHKESNISDNIMYSHPTSENHAVFSSSPVIYKK